MSRRAKNFEDYADEKLMSEFPKAHEWAYRRLLSRKTIFFDTRTHKLHAEFDGQDELVARSLVSAVTYSAKRYGVGIRLSRDEKRLIGSYFAPFSGGRDGQHYQV